MIGRAPDAWDVGDVEFVLDSVSALLSVWDTDTRLVYANPSFAHWVGTDTASIVGLPMAALVGADVAELTAPFVATAVAGEPVRLRRYVTDAAGVPRTFEVTLIPHAVAGEIRGFILLGSDTTTFDDTQLRRHAEDTRVALLAERQRIADDLDARVLADLLTTAVALAADEVDEDAVRHATKQLDTAIAVLRDTIGQLNASAPGPQRPIVPPAAQLSPRRNDATPPVSSPSVPAMPATPTGTRTRWSLAEALDVLDELPWLAVWDADLVNVFANRGAAAGLGASSTAELAGREYTELAGAELAAHNLPYAHAALAGTAQRFGVSFVDATGRERETHFVYSPLVRSGAVQGLVALLVDADGDADAKDRARTLQDVRERIAEDLHDTVIQRLYAAGLALESGRAEPAVKRSRLVAHARDCVLGAADDLAAAVHDIELDLRADVIASLVNAVAVATPGLGFAPRVDLIGNPDHIGPRAGADLVAVLTEALSNAARHARASDVHVTLSSGPRSVWLRVADDGVGFEHAPRRSGLANMANRAYRRGGTFAHTRNAPRGTVIDWRIPL